MDIRHGKVQILGIESKLLSKLPRLRDPTLVGEENETFFTSV